MKAGLAVTVAPHHLLLSTREAADLLRVSRTTLARLLETGAIPFEKPSRHRKVRLDDLLEYRRRQRSAAELALADMIADTELTTLRVFLAKRSASGEEIDAYLTRLFPQMRMMFRHERPARSRGRAGRAGRRDRHRQPRRLPARRPPGIDSPAVT